MTNPRVHTALVVVASRHGSTAEIGNRIAAALRAKLGTGTWRVDVEDSNEVDTIEGYDAVVLGSAIYFGRWLKSARRLLEKAGSAPTRGMWLFSSGPVAADAAGNEPAETHEDVATRLRVKDNVVFPGRIDVARLTRIERAVTKAMHIGGEDFRNWASVDAWADGIARELSDTAGANDRVDHGEKEP